MALPVLKIIELCAPLAVAALRLLDKRRAHYRDAHSSTGEPVLSIEQRLTGLERADVELSEVVATLSRRLEELAQAVAAETSRAQHEQRALRVAVAALAAATVIGWSVFAWALLR